MPRVFMTSTMKSDPGFSFPLISTAPRPAGAPDCPACCAVARGFVTRPAAPAAAPFRKPRRPTGCFDFDMALVLRYQISSNNDFADLDHGREVGVVGDVAHDFLGMWSKSL